MRAIGNMYIVYVRKMNIIGASSSSTETVIHTVTNVYMCKFIIFPEGGGGCQMDRSMYGVFISKHEVIAT